MIKKLLKITGLTLCGIMTFVSLYFAAAWCLSRIAIPGESSAGSLGGKDAPKKVAIFIRTNGAHTDIVMPVRNCVADWSRMAPCSNNVSPDTVYSYVAVGWGDKGFFLDMPTWDDLTLRLAFRAAFWMSSTAMHVTYYKDMHEDERCRRIEISLGQYAHLVDFIEGRFRRYPCAPRGAGAIRGRLLRSGRSHPDGRFINIRTDAAYGLTDAFYEARGHYNLFYTCNTWANDALAAAGQRHCAWTIFDKGIFLKYK